MSFVAIEMNKHGVACVKLNRPDVHNALNDVVIQELYDAFDMLGRHKDVRVITLTGSGKSFSAGADLTWMQRAAAQSEDENRADAVRLAHDALRLAAGPSHDSGRSSRKSRHLVSISSGLRISKPALLTPWGAPPRRRSTDAPYRPAYIFVWSTGWHGPAVPGSSAGRRLSPADAWQTNGAGRGAWRGH